MCNISFCPQSSQTLSSPLPCAPQNVKRAIEVTWWDQLRAPRTVQSMIQMVYNNKQAADEQLVQRIVQATLHPRYEPWTDGHTRMFIDRQIDREATLHPRYELWTDRPTHMFTDRQIDRQATLHPQCESWRWRRICCIFSTVFYFGRISGNVFPDVFATKYYKGVTFQ